MKTTKTIISIVLTFALLLSLAVTAPLTAGAAETFNKNFDISSSAELEAAAAEINAAEGGSYSITFKADIDNGFGACFKKNSVTILGENHYLSIADGSSAQGLVAVDSAIVNLGYSGYDKSFTIQNGNNNDNPGLLWTNGQNAVINMYNDVTVKDHKGDNYLGGGVTVESGTFNMYGGTIDNCGIGNGSVCYGGGVAVYNGGIFNMNGGTISNCYVTSDYVDQYDSNRCFTAIGGGVYVTNGSLFTMNGGTIKNCSATNFGGGVALDISYGEQRNSGMGNPKSKVTINNGSIIGNKAMSGAGIFASGYFYSYANPIASYAPGPGTQSDPGLYINNSTISGNSAEDDSGGGVFIAMLRTSNKVQINNTTINNNKAVCGAGVCSFGYWTNAEINGCTISNNKSERNGGGVYLSTNSSNGKTTIKDTTITGNTSGDRGAGVYYDADSPLYISGADVIQNNKYNGALNNLNILSSSKPVYVNGALTGSQIGLSDPKLWDDGLSDSKAPNDGSEVYLTSGYKANNSETHPSECFTSDHETWFPDFSENGNEVRLVRKQFDVNYHINNDDMSDIYADEIFTPYVTNHEVKEGNVIEEFHNIPKLKDPDGYVFKGWYYDRDNENDSRPIKFGETYQSDDADKYIKGVDIYAHWEKVEKVAKDPGDDKVLPASMNNEYFNFGLFGVQIRPDYWADKNIDRYELQPGGLRFITSISEDLLSKIDALSDKKVKNDEGQEHDVEYGYVAARKDQVDMFANHYGKNTANYELRYKGADVNGEDTTGATKDAEHDYRYITNVDCTSHEGKVDHKSFSQYRLSTFVVTYKDADSSAHKDDQICARAYLRYYDANGLLRTFYNDYGGTTTYGGCCTSFTEAEQGLASNTNTYYKEG